MSNPTKPNFKTEIIAVLLLIVSVLASFYFYANFPEQVPVHWDFDGQVNGYGSKAMGAFLFPAIIVAMYVLFLLLPYLDPKKDRYEQFAKTYHVFKTVLIAFMVAIYFISGLAGLGYNLNIASIMPVSTGILFMLLGNYMAKIKMNWFIGIRTPWTLSSEEVWNKTHRIGGKIFVSGGILIIFSSLMPISWRLPIFFAALILIIGGTIGYSYFAYRQEKKNNKPQN